MDSLRKGGLERKVNHRIQTGLKTGKEYQKDKEKDKAEVFQVGREASDSDTWPMTKLSGNWKTIGCGGGSDAEVAMCKTRRDRTLVTAE